MHIKQLSFSWERFLKIRGIEWVVGGSFWAAWLSINVDWLCAEWFGKSLVAIVTHNIIEFHWPIEGVVNSTTAAVTMAISIALAWIVFLHTQNRLFDLWELPARRTWLMSLILFWFFLVVVSLFTGMQIATETVLSSLHARPDLIWFWTAKVALLATSCIFTVWLAYSVVGPRVFYQQRMFDMALWVGLVSTLWVAIVMACFALLKAYLQSVWLITFAVVVALWLGVFFSFYFGANAVFVRTKYGQLIPKRLTHSDAEFIISYRLVGYLWWAQNSGRQLNEKALLNVMHDAGETQVFSVLEQLQQGNIIHKTQSQYWALSRDLSSMTLLDLYRVCSGMPGNWRAFELHGDPWDEALEPLLLSVADEIERLWNVGLRDLYSTAGPFVSQQKE